MIGHYDECAQADILSDGRGVFPFGFGYFSKYIEMHDAVFHLPE